MTDATTAAARLLASLSRRPQLRTCPICGTAFATGGPRGRYCSAKCKGVANAPKRKARREAARALYAAKTRAQTRLQTP